MKIRLHAFEPVSRANGPGQRAVVWFQGCSLGCRSCFNPATHDPQGDYEADTETLAAETLALGAKIEGISISGGEPFQQSDALLDLLDCLADSHLSRLVFTGYTMPEIQCFPLGSSLLRQIDVLIAGRYAAAQHVGQALLGSANQQIRTPRPPSAPPPTAFCGSPCTIRSSGRFRPGRTRCSGCG